MQQRRGRGFNKSYNDNGISNGQDRGSYGHGRGSNGQGRGSGPGRGFRYQTANTPSPFDFSSGRGGLISSIKVERLPGKEVVQQKEFLPEIINVPPPMNATPWIPKEEASIYIKNKPDWVKDESDTKPVLFGGNVAKTEISHDVINALSSKSVMERSASVMSGGTSTSINNGGSVVPANISASRCQECAVLRQKMITVFRSAAKTFNDFADVFQEFQHEKNNN